MSACTSCRLAKRKCDGSQPCARCVRIGRDDACVPCVPKKRGRPLKEKPTKENAPTPPIERPRPVRSAASISVAQIGEHEVDSEDVPDRAGEQKQRQEDARIQLEALARQTDLFPVPLMALAAPPQHALLSMVLSDGEDMLRNRTREIAECLDIHIGPNFILLKFEEMDSSFSDLLAPLEHPITRNKCMALVGMSFAKTVIIAGEIQYQKVDICGKTLYEIYTSNKNDVSTDEHDQEMWDWLRAPAGVCSINKRSFTAERNATWEAVKNKEFTSRAALLFNELGKPKYMLASFMESEEGAPPPDTFWDPGNDLFSFEDIFGF